jgi:signal transduction histidine kinase
VFYLSLRWKYIIATTFIILIILSVFSWQNLKIQEQQIEADDKERVELITEIIRNGLITMMLEGRGLEFQKFLETLIAKDIEEVRIFDEQGSIIASSIPKEIGNKIYKKDMDMFRSQSEPEVFTHKEKNKVFYSMVVPIVNEPACQKCHTDGARYRGVLDVEISMEKILNRLQSFRFQMVVFSVLTIIALSISLTLMTKHLINKPIDGIIDTMKKAEEGDLSARFETQRIDEVGKLSNSLNSMLFQLESATKEIEKLHHEKYQRIEKMASIGELAAAIAHEIKNPLAGISGAIQVFAEEFPDDDPKKEIVDDVIFEIERLDKAVRDLLNFARPPVPHPLFTSVGSMMERLIHVISTRAEKQNIDIQLNINAAIDNAFLDPEQFQQVFLNITLNAIQSMHDGGTLEIDVDKKDDMIEFSFKDSGIGIPSENKKNLFKPFFTTKSTGTGLGLSICKNIIDQHGGSIEVTSQPNKGSIFIIRTPLKEHIHEQS